MEDRPIDEEPHSSVVEDHIMEEHEQRVVNEEFPDSQIASIEDGPETKAVSMKFSFAKVKPSASRPPLFPKENLKADREDRVEYVTEFDGKGRKVETRIIPKQENSWRPEKRMKNIMVESVISANTEERFETDTLSTGPQPDVQYGLTVKVKQSKEGEADVLTEASGHASDGNNDSEAGPSFSELEGQRLREELQSLPEEASLDAYENLPVEEFGEALLRGMGWDKGKPIGRNSKTVASPIEYVRRVGREGLGAIPAPKPEKNKRFIKPGETRGSKPRSTVGKVMSIIAGIHAGLRGEVVGKTEADGSSSDSVLLRLVKGGEKVRVRPEEVAEIGSLEEEKAMKKIREIRIQYSERTKKYDTRDSGRELVTNNREDELEKRGERVESRARRKEDMNVNDFGRGQMEDRRSSDSIGSEKELTRSEKRGDTRYDGARSDDRTGRRDRKYEDEQYDREDKPRSRRAEKEDDYLSSEGKSRSRRAEKDDYLLSSEGKSRSRRAEKDHDLLSSEGKSRSRRAEKDDDHLSSEKKQSKLADNYGKEEKFRSRKAEKDDNYRHSEKGRTELIDRYERRDGNRRKDIEKNEGEESSFGREGKDRLNKDGYSDKISRGRKPEKGLEEAGPVADTDYSLSHMKSKQHHENTGTIQASHGSWMMSHIRVRIINKNLHGGKLYLKKGRVIDVSSPSICDIVMDESGELIQEVRQEHLETALPKRGGRVIVVGGKHRGLVGKLQERDSEKEVGLVQVEGNYELLSLNLDDLAEFVGDPDEMEL